jgi:hypothetical protein
MALQYQSQFKINATLIGGGLQKRAAFQQLV